VSEKPAFTLSGRIARFGLATGGMMALMVAGAALLLRLPAQPPSLTPLEELASAARSHGELLLEGEFNEILTLASTPLVTNALADPTGREAYLVPFLRSYRAGAPIRPRITLTDPQGRILAANRPEGWRLDSRPWLGQVLQDGRMATLLVGPERPLLVSAIPIRFPATQGKEGALIAEFDLDQLAAALLRPRPEGARLWIEVPGEARLPPPGQAPPGQATPGQNPAEGLTVIRQAMTVPGLGTDRRPVLAYGVHGKTPLPDSGQFPARLLTVTLGLLLALAGASTLTARRLAAPLTRLALAAQAMAAETTPVQAMPADGEPRPFDSGRLEEAAGIAQALERMRVRLQTLQRHVEDEVELRTRALGTAEQELARVLGSVQDAICSIDRGTGALLYVNAAAETITGYPASRLLARPELWSSLIHPEDAQIWRGCLQALTRVRDHGEAEFRIRAADGTARVLHARCRLRWAAAESAGDPGETALVDATLTDITERRRAEETVRISETRLRTIFNTVADGIITIDAHGVIEGINPAAERLFGWTATEILGRNIATLMPEEAARRHSWYLARYRETGNSDVLGTNREMVGRRRDGALVPLELTLSEMKLGPTPSFIGLIRDITGHKRAEEALRAARDQAEQANQGKSDLLAMVSHEIRTPTAGLLGLLALVAEEPLSDEQRRCIGVAQATGALIQTLLNDILDFSRMEAGGLELESREFDLRTVLDEVIALHRPFTAGKPLTLDAVIAADVPQTLTGDAVRLRQSLNNLVSNALKFTDQGTIKVEVRGAVEARGAVDGRGGEGGNEPAPAPGGKAETLLFAVTDTGIGIPAEALPLLFHRYSQLDNGDARRPGGSGLGLAITRTLVRLMGGEIGCNSQPGQGSRFWFTLPVTPGSGAGSGTAARRSPPPAADRRPLLAPGLALRPKLLLVDDNETNRMVIGAYLGRAGYPIDMATNGWDAVDAVARGEYGLVLMDVAMPEMDGYEATRAIRALPAPRNAIPILAMTAYALSGDRAKCLEAGMNDYLTKPIDRDVLIERVADWLNRAPPPAAGWAASTAEPEEEEEDQIGAGLPVDRSVLAAVAEDIPGDGLRMVAGVFLEDSRKLVDALAAAGAEGDVSRLTRESHRLKSAARTFGMNALGNRAAEIERLIREGRLEAAASLARHAPDQYARDSALFRSTLDEIVPPAASG
jgi:PAS domain S-box-containing protein